MKELHFTQEQVTKICFTVIVKTLSDSLGKNSFSIDKQR